MKWIYPILFVLFTVFQLRKNYSQDEGQHKKAKIIHASLICLLLFSYLGSLSQIIRLMTNFSQVAEATYGAGMFSKEVHLAVKIIRSTLSVVALWYFWKMVGRDNGARKIAIHLFPFLGLMASFSFYFGFIGADESSQELWPSWITFLIALIVMMGIYLGIRQTYQASFMRRFFEMDHEEGWKSKDDLEGMISTIGEDPPQ